MCTDIPIAIIIVNYNGYSDTVDCINSLLNTSTISKSKIIVIDNGSKKDEASELQRNFPEIQAIRNEENLGFAGANNLGIKMAMNQGCQYMLLLNNDTVVKNDFLAELMANAETTKICAPKMMYYAEQDKIWYGGGEINRKTGRAIHLHMDEKDNDECNSSTCSFATFCCVLIPRQVIDQIGLLDDTYFMYCEDTEYCLRLEKNNIKITYVPSSVIWHKVSSSTGGGESAFSIYYMTRNRIRYMRKYKNSFYMYAIVFTVITRYIKAFRMLLKKDKRYYSYINGIKDGFHDITGSVSLTQ